MKDTLLRKGFFPKEFPPVFSTSTFADYVSKIDDLELTPPPGKKYLISRPAIHNLGRPGQLRRKLQIPNPLNYLELVDIIVAGWGEIQKHIEKSTYSTSKPSNTSDMRAFLPEYSGMELPVIRCRKRSLGRFLLKTDISRYYHSIYTHSIPWALMGKAASKAKRSGGLGNDLDRAIRNSQDGQTLGIPIGPDTSLIIAEIIGAAIDEQLQKHNSQGMRYIDDFDLSYHTRSEAEKGLVLMEKHLSYFELAINPLKTSIISLPQPLEKMWVNKIRQFEFDDESKLSETNLLHYFNLVFELSKLHTSEPVVTYAIGRLRSVDVPEDRWEFFQDLIFQCAINEPSSMPSIVGLLYKHSHYTISALLDTLLNRIILTHSELGHSSEVTWSLWTACWFEQKLSIEAVRAASRMDDPFVSLIILLAYEKGVFKGTPDLKIWSARVAATELYDKNWPLAYEVRRRGWLSKVAKIEDVRAGSDFEKLLTAGVSFLDPDPEAPVSYLFDISGYGDLVDADPDRESGDTL